MAKRRSTKPLCSLPPKHCSGARAYERAIADNRNHCIICDGRFCSHKCLDNHHLFDLCKPREFNHASVVWLTVPDSDCADMCKITANSQDDSVIWLLDNKGHIQDASCGKSLVVYSDNGPVPLTSLEHDDLVPNYLMVYVETVRWVRVARSFCAGVSDCSWLVRSEFNRRYGNSGDTSATFQFVSESNVWSWLKTNFGTAAGMTLWQLA